MGGWKEEEEEEEEEGVIYGFGETCFGLDAVRAVATPAPLCGHIVITRAAAGGAIGANDAGSTGFNQLANKLRSTASCFSHKWAAVGGCGRLWVAVGGCGWLWVAVGGCGW